MDITSIVIAGMSFLGTLGGAYFASNKNQAVMNERIETVRGEINTLSARVDKHNNLIERMVVVEQSVKSAHHRLDSVEKKEER